MKSICVIPFANRQLFNELCMCVKYSMSPTTKATKNSFHTFIYFYRLYGHRDMDEGSAHIMHAFHLFKSTSYLFKILFRRGV